MLGPAKRRSLGLPVTVSLEALVPADHFYRHLDATLDRSFVREWAAAYVERVKGYVGTEAFKKAMRKRQVWVEPLFGEAKQWHNLRQFRLRRLWRVNCEVLLVAAGQYLKRWLSRTGWGRRHGPAGSLALSRSPPAAVTATGPT